MRSALHLALVVLALAGCKSIIEATDRAECAERTDCPAGEICQAGVCVEPPATGDGAQARDTQPRDTQPRDAQLHDAQRPDPVDAAVALPDAEPDVAEIDAAAPDAARPDAGVVHYPAGDCFATAEQGQLGAAQGHPSFVPAAWCTPQMLAWIEWSDHGARLQAQLGADQRRGLELPGAPLLVRGSRVYFEQVEVIEALPIRVLYVVDLADEAPIPSRLLPDPLTDQVQPAAGAGVVAFVEVHADGRRASSRIVIARGGTRRSCTRAGFRQWGVALETGRIAWFEQAIGSDRTALIIASLDDCVGDRVEIALAGRVGWIDPSAQLALSTGHLVWLGTEAGGARAAQAWALNLDDLPAGVRLLEPVGTPGSAVELSVAGGLAAVVRYSPGGHRLEVHDLVSGAAWSAGRSETARHPTFSDTYLLFAARSGVENWGIYYVARDVIRAR